MTESRNPPPKNTKTRGERPAISPDLSRMVEGILHGMNLGKELLGAEHVQRHSHLMAILILLRNEADNKATESKEVIAELGQSAGAARSALARLQERNLIEVSRRVGRSPLFRPTSRLITRVERWIDETSNHLA